MLLKYYFKAKLDKEPLLVYGPFETPEDAELYREAYKKEGFDVGMKYQSGRIHAEHYRAIDPRKEST